jgi:hypothetical protein
MTDATAAQDDPLNDNTPGDDRPGDDVKAKFRAALERKQAQAKAGSAHTDAGSKIHHAGGPATQKRNFRRKSG